MGRQEKERQAYLLQELKEYADNTEMTKEEYKVLKDWVKDGNSVHENGSMACYEGGRPVDFLDVYREEEEIQKKLDSLTGEARKRYLCELRNEPYLPDVQRENGELKRKLDAYKRVLEKHGLLNEAAELYADWCGSPCSPDISSKELPFN